MKKCNICGYLNDENNLFCAKCGNKLENETQNNQYQTDQNFNNSQNTYYQPSTDNNIKQESPTTVKKKKKGCFTKGLTLIGGIVVFFIVLLLFVSFLSSSSDETENTTTTINSEEPTTSKEDFIDSCNEYTYDEIARNPNDYVGKPAKFTGEVIQVVQNGTSVTLRVNITAEENSFTESGYLYSDTIYVEYTTNNENESRVLEKDIITIYGTLNGIKDYNSVLGEQISCPYLIAKYIYINR